GPAPPIPAPARPPRARCRRSPAPAGRPGSRAPRGARLPSGRDRPSFGATMSNAPPISGFTMVRNATRLDFPVEASIRSLLPAVDELVVNVGDSGDDTMDRIRAIDDPRIRIVTSTWDPTQGHQMLATETARAM